MQYFGEMMRLEAFDRLEELWGIGVTGLLSLLHHPYYILLFLLAFLVLLLSFWSVSFSKKVTWKMLFYNGAIICAKVVISLSFIFQVYSNKGLLDIEDNEVLRLEDVYLTPEKYVVAFGLVSSYFVIHLIERRLLLGSDTKGVSKLIFSINGDLEASPQVSAVFPQPPNFIFIQFESLDDWILDYQFNGKLIAPFLSELKRHSLYFENFSSPASSRGSSDTERMSLTGLLPPYFFKRMNIKESYHSLVDALNEEGYQTASFHNNNATYFDRDQLHKNLGFQEMYFGAESFEGEGMGTMYALDKPYYQQSVKYMGEFRKPFFAYFITMQHHYPFTTYRPETRDDFVENFKKLHRTDQKFIDLIASLYDADQALEVFFMELSRQGLLDNTFVFIYSDHSAYDNMQSERLAPYIPLIVYHKDLPDVLNVASSHLLFQVNKDPQNSSWLEDLNFKKGVYLKASSHIDIPATVAYILGIKEGESWLGSSLVSPKTFRLGPEVEKSARTPLSRKKSTYFSNLFTPALRGLLEVREPSSLAIYYEQGVAMGYGNHLVFNSKQNLLQLDQKRWYPLKYHIYYLQVAEPFQ